MAVNEDYQTFLQLVIVLLIDDKIGLPSGELLRQDQGLPERVLPAEDDGGPTWTYHYEPDRFARWVYEFHHPGCAEDVPHLGQTARRWI
jgi:hypothetical protein